MIIGPRIPAFPHDNVGQGQGHNRLGPWPQRDPLIRILTGQRKARGQEDHPPLGAVVIHPRHLGKAPVVFHGGEPGLQKVGPKGEHQPGLSEIISGQAIPPEGNPCGFPEGRLGKTLVLSSDASHRRKKVVDKIGEGWAHPPSEEDVVSTFTKPLCQELLGLLPSDGAKAIGAPAHWRR